MKRIISAIILILLLFVSADTIKSPKVNLQVDLVDNADTACIVCYRDSLKLAINDIENDIVKIDSISRRVRKNAKSISRNTEYIQIMLENCNTDDPVCLEPKDTVVHKIEVRKKNKIK